MTNAVLLGKPEAERSHGRFGGVKMSFALLFALSGTVAAASEEILPTHTAANPLSIQGAASQSPISFTCAGADVLTFAERAGESASTSLTDYAIDAWKAGAYPWVWTKTGVYELQGQKISLKGRYTFGQNGLSGSVPVLSLKDCVIATSDTDKKTDSNLFFQGGKVVLDNCAWTNTSGRLYFAANTNSFLDVQIKGGAVQWIPQGGVGHVTIGGFGTEEGSGTRVTISGRHVLANQGAYFVSVGTNEGKSEKLRGCDASLVIDGPDTLVDCGYGASHWGRVTCGSERTHAFVVVTNGATLRTGDFYLGGYNGKLQIWEGTVTCQNGSNGSVNFNRGFVEVMGGHLDLRTDFNSMGTQGDATFEQKGGLVTCNGIQNRKNADTRMIRMSAGHGVKSSPYVTSLNLYGGRFRCRYGIRGEMNVASESETAYAYAYLNGDGGLIEVMPPHADAGAGAQFILERLDRAAVGPKGLTIESDFDYTLRQSFTNLVDEATSELTSGRLVLSGTNAAKRATLTLAAPDSACDWMVLSGCTGIVDAAAVYRSHFVVTNDAVLAFNGSAATAGLTGLTLGDATTKGTLVLTGDAAVSVAGQVSCPNGEVVLSSALAKNAARTLFVSTVEPTAETVAHWADGLTIADGAAGAHPAFRVKKVGDVWHYTVTNACLGLMLLLK